ncbi:unnamed protein product [Camellia sinensis]
MDIETAIVNHDGFNFTVTPSGTSTAQRYVSGLVPTFLTIRLTNRKPLSDEIVTEGVFRSDGLAKGVLHDLPVAVLIFDGSVFGREHKKLM